MAEHTPAGEPTNVKQALLAIVNQKSRDRLNEIGKRTAATKRALDDLERLHGRTPK